MCSFLDFEFVFQTPAPWALKFSPCAALCGLKNNLSMCRSTSFECVFERPAPWACKLFQCAVTLAFDFICSPLVFLYLHNIVANIIKSSNSCCKFCFSLTSFAKPILRHIAFHQSRMIFWEVWPKQPWLQRRKSVEKLKCLHSPQGNLPVTPAT